MMRLRVALCCVVLWCCAVVPAFGVQYFQDPNNIWNRDVSGDPVHDHSDDIISFIVDNGGFDASGNLIRIDFSNVINYADSNTPRYAWAKGPEYYEGECDDELPEGNTFPLPPGGSIEGGGGGYTGCDGDCHILVVHSDEAALYEVYQGDFDGTTLTATCVVRWNLCANYGVAGRGEQCTSVDAGGLAFTPGVVTATEVNNNDVNHAFRFVLWNGMIGLGSGSSDIQYVHPANHAPPGGPTSNNQYAPLYGTRFRLKADVDVSTFPQPLQVICNALKKYGAILTDGTNQPAFSLIFQVDGYDPISWDDDLGITQRVLSDNGITADDFEVLAPPDAPIDYTGDCNRLPYPTDTCQVHFNSSSSSTGNNNNGKSSAGRALRPSFFKSVDLY